MYGEPVDPGYVDQYATFVPHDEQVVVLFLILLKSEVNGATPEVIE